MLPFTTQQFFDVFAAYNTAIWPAQLVAYFGAVLVLAASFAGSGWASRVAALFLGAVWIWNGIAYHAIFFAPVNPAAYGFAALFVVQGFLFWIEGTVRGTLQIVWQSDLRGVVALALFAYAVVDYGLLGLSFGHQWPAAPVFGVAPCPSAIFTFGALMLVAPSTPKYLWVIPVVWAVIGSSAAVLLGVVEDYGLAVAAVAALVLVFGRGVRPPAIAISS